MSRGILNEVQVMITTTYYYYKNEYGGELSEEDFNRNLKKAQRKINAITSGMYDAVTDDTVSADMRDNVRQLTCNVLDKLSRLENNESEADLLLGVTSVKVGSISKTYSSGDVSAKSISGTIDGTIRNDVMDYCGQYGWGCRWV